MLGYDEEEIEDSLEDSLDEWLDRVHPETGEPCRAR